MSATLVCCVASTVATSSQIIPVRHAQTSAETFGRPNEAATGAVDPMTAVVATAFQAITDLPIPTGVEFDAERPIVLGGLDQWTGRLVLELAQPTGEVFLSFREQMPEFGWPPVMSVQAKANARPQSKANRARLAARPLWSRSPRVRRNKRSIGRLGLWMHPGIHG